MAFDIRHGRLMADYEKMMSLQAASPLVEILDSRGIPPEHYLVLLRCKGITGIAANGEPQFSEEHRLQIELPSTYPRNIPSLKMLTPIWHPNVNQQQGWICMGHEGDKGYVPSMSLDDLVIHIIQIIRYENYSKEHFLNHAAFLWAQKNAHLFPLDNRPVLDEPVEVMILDDGVDRELLDEIIIQEQ